MSEKILDEASQQIPIERLEAGEYSAEDFSAAFSEVCALERKILSAKLGLSEQTLSPSNLSASLQPNQFKIILDRMDLILNSEENQRVVDNYSDQHSHEPLLKDADMRQHLVELAKKALVGGYIDQFLHNKTSWLSRPDLKLYKSRLIDVHNAYIDFIESPVAADLSFDRGHLRRLIRAAYGRDLDGSTGLADAIESGIAVEVATKRYIENLLRQHDAPPDSVRFGTVQEDLRGGDIVYSAPGGVLFIDVKSGDKDGANSNHEKSSRASTMEDFGPREFRVRELHPASHHSIGSHFEIKEGHYRSVIEKLIQKFEHRVLLAA